MQRSKELVVPVMVQRIGCRRDHTEQYVRIRDTMSGRRSSLGMKQRPRHASADRNADAKSSAAVAAEELMDELGASSRRLLKHTLLSRPNWRSTTD